MRAVRVHELTGPAALRVDEVPDLAPGAGQIVIDVRAAGVNFPDILITRGQYQFKPALPFSLLLPHASLFWTGPLVVVIGLVPAYAFPAIVVFAQELVPGKVGMISGLFFGFSFGMGGIGAAVLGWLADRAGIETVYQICAVLPAIGLLAAFLPDPRHR